MEDSIRVVCQAEFENLGFSPMGKDIFVGRVPSQGNIDGVFITVEINLTDYPLKQPSIRLVSINDKHELFKCIPKTWRHIDESMQSSNPRDSQFSICSLHNWSSSSKYTMNFIYTRILDWLNSNVKESWLVDDDLLTWRILPQLSNSFIYLDEEFIKEFQTLEPLKLYEFSAVHSVYNLKTGKISTSSKIGNAYSYDDILFPSSNESPYYYFVSESSEDKVKLIKAMNLKEKDLISKFSVIRLPHGFQFKTTYQLMQTLILNTDIRKLQLDYKNLPFIVLYNGDRGKTEYLAFVTSFKHITGNDINSVQIINIEIIPETILGIDFNIGVLGAGSLGSQICKMLAHKKVRTLVISDFDRLSITNLGNHELFSNSLGDFKSVSLAHQLEITLMQKTIPKVIDSEALFEYCDMLIVAVGRKQAFDLLAFRDLINYSKPIIWVWTSPNNILQEIVITTPTTGCLNCYYKLIEENTHLKSLHQQAEMEIAKYPSEGVDLCGNPHTISMWERMSLLAGQVTTIISLYAKDKKFKYDYYNYYWKMDEIMPSHIFGLLEQNPTCFCKGDLT